MEEIKKSYSAKWFHMIPFIICFFIIQIFDVLNLAYESFVFKNIFLIIFLFFNIYNYKKYNPHNWLLNPAVLASIMTFLIGYCITNYVYFIPGSEDEILMFKLLGPDPLLYINKGIDAVIISVIAMWIGYKTDLGVKLYRLITSFPINLKKFTRPSFNPNMKLIYFIIALAYAVRVLSIYLGIFGYAQTEETRQASMGFYFILYSISSLSSLALMVVAYAHFSSGARKKYKILFFTLLVLEVGSGIIGGMKSGVLMPLILSFIIYYLVNNKFHKGLLIALPVFIIIAYVIIEPFRILKTYNPNFKSTPANIINTMIEGYKLSNQLDVTPSTSSIFQGFMSRNASLLGVARSIQYADHPGLKAGDPDFLKKLYTIPLQAFIPRLIWKSKPIEDQSSWYSVVVWGSTPTNSVAMTPMGFLYFAGGYTFIVFGFFFIGIMQKTLWQFFHFGGGQLLIFLGLLSTVALIDSAYNGIIVNWLIYLPMFVILQMIILKKPEKNHQLGLLHK